MVDVEAIQWLAESDLGRLLREHRGSIQREMQVYFAKEADAKQCCRRTRWIGSWFAGGSI